MTITQRIALVVGVGFLALACWAAFVPAHSDPYSCGTWPNPKLSDSYFNSQLDRAKEAYDQGSSLGVDTSGLIAATVRLRSSKDSCDSKLGLRETLTWVGVAGLIVGPLVVLFLGGELGRRRPSTT